jgi:alpha-ketoglutarate-dependent taurine dioxygenase
LHQPKALEFHTDYPGARFVGWWGVAQDEDGGARDLVDGLTAVQRLSAESAACLRRTPITSYGRDRLPRVQWPLLFRRGPGLDPGINYNPFGWPERTSVEATHALLEFRLALREQFARAPLSVRLLPGQSLWIDNWRMLHGRGAIDPHATRHLKRIWIQDTTPAATTEGRFPAR